MNYVIEAVRISALLLCILLVFPIIIQNIRALVHDRGYKISATDIIAAISVVLLFIFGLPEGIR